MDQKSHDVLISYDNKLYEFPSELEERFIYLTRKMEYAASNPDYNELLAGLKVVFKGEYGIYEHKS